MKAGTMVDVTAYSANDWERLGAAIRNRRAARGLTQEELAEAAGCSEGTIRNLEQGKRARLLTLPGVSRALGWTEDSYAIILDGGEPVEVEEQPPNHDALHIPRPDGIGAGEWAELVDKMHADVEFWLRHRRP